MSSPPRRTAVDELLDDPRLQEGMATFSARVKAGLPVRWHRLIHATLGCQLHASPDLAMVTEMQWRLAQAGIETVVESEWLNTKG